MNVEPAARERRHTLHFLEQARAFSPVFLDTEVDMSAVVAHRAAARAAGVRYSVVSYVLYAAARALAAHPEANAAIQRGRTARIARYGSVNGKLALDKTVNGRRVVLSAVLPSLQQAGLDEIQRKVDRYRDADPAVLPEFAGVRMLHRLPLGVGARMFRAGMRSLRRRPGMMGTFAVSSLGHRPVDSFHSVGGTTVTLGVGRIADRPVVVASGDGAGQIAVAPVMRLSLSFDHRVIDGAEAADVLADVKSGLEHFDAPVPAAEPAGYRGTAAGNDVDELKQFAALHARAQGIPDERLARLMESIANDDEGAPDSWAAIWTEEARREEAAGRFLKACQYYNMARFPFVDGPTRARALAACTDAFALWAVDRPDVERLDVALPGGRVRCWTSGLSDKDRKPLLLVVGGIVSIKEQWAPILLMARRMGMAGLVTEVPGVGENSLPYDADSWRMLSGLLDAVADRADVSRTYAIALSFSGHLALRCATEDRRIRGVATAGAPIREFFTDAQWQKDLPRVTIDTLAHLTGIDESEFADRLAPWALDEQQLAALDIPVHYVHSTRDEIIPPGEARLLRARLRRLSLLEIDDVHGSPDHTLETRLWILRSVLRMRGVGGPQAALLAALSAAVGARRRLASGRRRTG